MSGRIPRDPAVETLCVTCGASVVIVHLAYTLATLDPLEFEFPIVGCPMCHGDPRKQLTCGRCLGTGFVGHTTPHTAVAVDERDRARPWHRGIALKRGEGLYPVHHCGQVAASSPHL